VLHITAGVPTVALGRCHTGADGYSLMRTVIRGEPAQEQGRSVKRKEQMRGAVMDWTDHTPPSPEHHCGRVEQLGVQG